MTKTVNDFIEDNKTPIITTVGGSAAIGGLGALAGHYVPGLKEKKTGLKGWLNSTKNLFVIPMGHLTNGKLGKKYSEVFGWGPEVERLKLTPSVIRDRSIEKLKLSDPNFDSYDDLEKFKLSKKFDVSVTKSMIEEQEALAKSKGIKTMIGPSHFPPDVAAYLGYTYADEVSPALDKRLWKALYYGKQKKESLGKLKSLGTAGLNVDDAYWIAADPDNIRLFKKDLTLEPSQAKAMAIETVKKIPENVRKLRNDQEALFKGKFDEIVQKILTAKKFIKTAEFNNESSKNTTLKPALIRSFGIGLNPKNNRKL